MMQIGVQDERYIMMFADTYEGAGETREGIAFLQYMLQYPYLAPEIEEHIRKCIAWAEGMLHHQDTPN